LADSFGSLLGSADGSFGNEQQLYLLVLRYMLLSQHAPPGLRVCGATPLGLAHLPLRRRRCCRLAWSSLALRLHVFS